MRASNTLKKALGNTAFVAILLDNLKPNRRLARLTMQSRKWLHDKVQSFSKSPDERTRAVENSLQKFMERKQLAGRKVRKAKQRYDRKNKLEIHSNEV